MSDSASQPLPRRLLRPIGRLGLIWQMIALAFVIHVVLLLVLSPNLFSSDAASPERLFQQGEAELARGNYTEAQRLYQQVMELQPKVPPIFEKAAEQHRTAERLARRGPVSEGTPKETTPASLATNPVKVVEKTVANPMPPATKPASNFVPPELRP